MGVPPWLCDYRLLGVVGGHSVLHIESQIYAYWLEGHFARRHLDEMTNLIANNPAWDRLYVSLAFTDGIEGYDPDLRTVMSEPGELAERSAFEAIVVTANPLERMVVRTMALAGRAAGNPGGRLSTVATFDQALLRARSVLLEASR